MNNDMDKTSILLNRINILKNFIGATNEEINNVISEFEYIEIPRGEIIYRQGDPADTLYMLLDGYVMMDAINSSGNEMEIFTHRNQIFPLSSLFRPLEYRQTAVSMYNTKVLKFKKNILEQLAYNNQNIMCNLFKELAYIMESEDNRMTLYASRNIEEKAIRLLLFLGKEIGNEFEECFRIRNIFNITQLSKMACVSRESMSYQINKLRKKEIIYQDNDYFIIKKEIEKLLL